MILRRYALSLIKTKNPFKKTVKVLAFEHRANALSALETEFHALKNYDFRQWGKSGIITIR